MQVWISSSVFKFERSGFQAFKIFQPQSKAKQVELNHIEPY